ncbi:MAG TPA: hypothetical protein VG056_15515, partial [Pirellulales bacterium]|nr:hypothetical protein [Pirellulales bacterium]
MALLGLDIMAGSGAVWRALIDVLGLIGSLTPLYFMVKCFASRRPGADAKAGWALAAVFAAIAIPGLTIIVGQHLSAVVGEEIARSLLFLNAGVLMLGLLLTGLIVSAIAWAEIRRDGEPHRNRGRPQTIAAFVSSLTLVCLMIGASEFLPFAQRNEANENRWQETADARASHSVRPPAIVAAEGAASSASQPKAAAAIDIHISDTPKQLKTAAAASAITSSERIGATPAKVRSPAQAAANSTTAVQKSATALTDSGTTTSTKPSTTAAFYAKAPEPSSSHISSAAAAEKQAADKQNWGRLVEALFGDTATQPHPMAIPPAPIETVKNERLNFQFRPPDAQWVAADAKRFNRNAAAVFMRKSPEVLLMIIAERIGVERKLTTEGLFEFCRATMLTAAPDALQIEQRPQIVNGLAGMRLVHQATVKGVLLHYVQWLCMYNGFSYQVIVSGRASERSSIAAEADRALGGFDLIDSFAECHADGIAPLQEFSIAQDGFSLKLGDRGWHLWDKLATVFPSAEFGALRGTTGVVVIPIHFDVLKPARDARLEAFLGIFGCANPEPTLDKRDVIRIDNLSATQCTFERPGFGGGDLYYSLGVAQTDDFDYCFSVWSTKSKLDAASALHDVLSGVSFTPVKKLPQKPIASNGERQRYGKFFNFVGLHYLRARQAFESEP